MTVVTSIFKKSQIHLKDGVRSSTGAFQRSQSRPKRRMGRPPGKELKLRTKDFSKARGSEAGVRDGKRRKKAAGDQHRRNPATRAGSTPDAPRAATK